MTQKNDPVQIEISLADFEAAASTRTSERLNSEAERDAAEFVNTLLGYNLSAAGLFREVIMIEEQLRGAGLPDKAQALRDLLFDAVADRFFTTQRGGR